MDMFVQGLRNSLKQNALVSKENSVESQSTKV